MVSSMDSACTTRVPLVRWIPALVFIHRILTAFRSDRSGRKRHFEILPEHVVYEIALASL